MKTFEEAWKTLGYNYGEDELESVKLGWELCLNEVFNAVNKELSQIKWDKREKDRVADIQLRYKIAKQYESEGNFERADWIRPCCDNEDRENGRCKNCGDPSF